MIEIIAASKRFGLSAGACLGPRPLRAGGSPVVTTAAAAATITTAATASAVTAAATTTTAATVTTAAATTAATFSAATTAAAAVSTAAAATTTTAAVSTAAAATTAAVSTAAAATTTGGSAAALFSLVDTQGTTAHVLTIQLIEGGLTRFSIGKGDKCEPALTAGFAIDGIEEVSERFPRGEHTAEFDLGGLVRDIAYVEFHGLLAWFAWFA